MTRKYWTARKLYRVEREARVTATYYVMARNLEEAKTADVPRYAALRFWPFGSARTERAKAEGPTDYKDTGVEAVDHTNQSAAGTITHHIKGSDLQLTQQIVELTISYRRPEEIDDETSHELGAES